MGDFDRPTLYLCLDTNFGNLFVDLPDRYIVDRDDVLEMDDAEFLSALLG